MATQNANTTTAQILSAAMLTEIEPELFTDIVLYWLSPLNKTQWYVRTAPGNLPRYNPDPPANGSSEPFLAINNRIFIE
ncbi:MAG: hypothetical protein DPW09_19435 [Anaerolineae bacterium]|nr:hypothetical protein [Anaerolineales bacterium]MCQ3975614.1 hypothetical protein [Anaerolineae bacterium]